MECFLFFCDCKYLAINGIIVSGIINCIMIGGQMEIWDLYDKYRNKLDITMNRGDEVPENCYRLAIKLCIFNSNGEMLIQQRSSNKEEYADSWDISVRGSAISGESSEAAVKRETKEELGIDIDNESIRPYLTVHHSDWFDDIYIMSKEVDLSKLVLQKTEVSAVNWVSKAEIINMMEKGSFVPYESSLISLLFSKGVSREQ